MAWQLLVFSLALVPLSLVPLRSAGLLCVAGGLMLSSGFLYCAVALALSRSNATARRLLIASIIYLPLIFSLMMFSLRTPPG